MYERPCGHSRQHTKDDARELQHHLLQVSVLIVGAGPTGLGAATRIQQHGLRDWLIIDQVTCTQSISFYVPFVSSVTDCTS